jgi:hypothetical protein
MEDFLKIAVDFDLFRRFSFDWMNLLVLVCGCPEFTSRSRCVSSSTTVFSRLRERAEKLSSFSVRKEPEGSERRWSSAASGLLRMVYLAMNSLQFFSFYSISWLDSD